MDDGLENFARKIEAAQNSSKESPSRIVTKERKNDGAQAGMEFVLCIAFATFIGYHLDAWLKTGPIFLISLFFIGVAAGFWSLYKYANNLSAARKVSVLQDDKKDANKAPENVLSDMNIDTRKDI